MFGVGIAARQTSLVGKKASDNPLDHVLEVLRLLSNPIPERRTSWRNMFSFVACCQVSNVSPNQEKFCSNFIRFIFSNALDSCAIIFGFFS